MPRAKKTGSPPTPRKARTGEFTPPGMCSLARSNSSCERPRRDAVIGYSFAFAFAFAFAVVVLGVRRGLDGVVGVIVAREVLLAREHLDRRRLHLARLVLALGQRLDGDHVLALVDAHQAHALRVAPERRDALDGDADDLAATR